MTTDTASPHKLLPWQSVEEFYLDKLLESLSSRGDSAELLRHAYGWANEAHLGQYRKSGESYMTHPLAVASILSDFELNEKTIVAALLHDVVEDTDLSLEDIKSEFGNEIASIVDGVTKLDKFQFNTENEAKMASMKKLMKAADEDLRVLFIKLADRLHNMSTLGVMPTKRQKIIATETLRVYAPLARRLGMQDLSCQLEDLAFSTLHAKWFAEIDQMVETNAPERELYLTQIETQVEYQLSKEGIQSEIFIRPKHLWSIYQKMESGKEFQDINDLMGIRIVVESVADCYATLGHIHSMWRVLPGHFKDHIAVPKFNLYQSLHTTVLGPLTKSLEIQIRTQEMDDRAERGIAAHWSYKEAGDSDIALLNRMIDWVEEANTPSGAVDYSDLEYEEILVLTPKGDLISLPEGSTPVDFAYAVHTNLGHSTRGAKVNGSSVKLSTPLCAGDSVEITAEKDALPFLEWREFVVSQKALSAINQWHKTQSQKSAVNVNLFETENEFEDELTPNRDDKGTNPGILVEGQDDIWVRVAQCCSPNRSDEILGFVTRGKGVSIHTSECKNVAFLSVEEPTRFIQVEWDSWQRPTHFIDVEVRALDRSGLLRDILSAMPPQVFIGNMTSKKGKGGVANIKFQLEINDDAQSEQILKSLRQVSSVYNAVKK